MADLERGKGGALNSFLQEKHYLRPPREELERLRHEVGARGVDVAASCMAGSAWQQGLGWCDSSRRSSSRRDSSWLGLTDGWIALPQVGELREENARLREQLRVFSGGAGDSRKSSSSQEAPSAQGSGNAVHAQPSV